MPDSAARACQTQDRTIKLGRDSGERLAACPRHLKDAERPSHKASICRCHPPKAVPALNAPDSPFWRGVRTYRRLGLDPLKWIAGCSVEVDAAEVLYPAAGLAAQPLAEMAATLQVSEGPDLFEAHDERTPAQRAVVRTGAKADGGRRPARTNPLRAALVARVLSPQGETPQAFAGALSAAVAGLPPRSQGPDAMSLDAPLTLRQVHGVTTADPAAEFAAFEFYGGGFGPFAGYAAASCATLQISDPTLDPLAEEHVATVVAGALAGPCSVGASGRVELYPLYDGAGQKARDTLAAAFASQAGKHGVRLVERGPIGPGKLFVGATVVAQTDREPPNRHHYVKRGMQVTLTRPFGDLAPLACYLSCLSDGDYAARAEAAGHSVASLGQARRISTEALTTPALAAGEVIGSFCPPLRQPPELKEHLVATADLGAGGLVALADLARRFEITLRVDSLPLAAPAIAAFATSARLMDNATACAPGAIAIVAYPPVLDEVERALEERHLSPSRVATVEGRGTAAVKVPQEAATFIGSKRLLGRLSVGTGSAA